jgi:hypothetical protein
MLRCAWVCDDRYVEMQFPPAVPARLWRSLDYRARVWVICQRLLPER